MTIGLVFSRQTGGTSQILRVVIATGDNNTEFASSNEFIVLETGVIPAVNQIELHPYCQKAQQEVVDECLKHHIVLTAYSPLGSGYADLLKEPLIEEIAKKYGVTPANVLINVLANKAHHTGGFICTSRLPPRTLNLNLNHFVIPKSVVPSRIEGEFPHHDARVKASRHTASSSGRIAHARRGD